MTQKGEASGSPLPPELDEGVEVAANRVAMILHAQKCQKVFPYGCCKRYPWCEATRQLIKHSSSSSNDKSTRKRCSRHDICRVTQHWWAQWKKDKARAIKGGTETELLRRVNKITFSEVFGEPVSQQRKASSTTLRKPDSPDHSDIVVIDADGAPTKSSSTSMESAPADAAVPARRTATANDRAAWTADEAVRELFESDFDPEQNKVSLEEALQLPADSSLLINFKCSKQMHRQPRYCMPLRQWVAMDGPYKCPGCKARPPEKKKDKFKDLPADVRSKFEQAYDEEGSLSRLKHMTIEWARKRSIGSRNVVLWKCPNHPDAPSFKRKVRERKKKNRTPLLS